MSDTDHLKQAAKFNFNTLIGVVMLGVLAWLGKTVLDSSRQELVHQVQLELISKKLDAIMPREEIMLRLARLEIDANKNSADIAALTLELVKMKGKP